MVDGGYARTHAVFDGDKLLTDEAISRVAGIQAGPVRIALLETHLKLEYPLDGEPTVSYAMTIAGVENAGEPVAGLGGAGITLAGQQVAGRELIDQFNAEVTKGGAALKEQAWANHILLVAPTTTKDDDGGVHATGPALEIGQVNTGRQGQGGSHFGVRLGFASAYAILNSLEGVVPDAGGVPPDLASGSDGGTGDSPLEGQFGDESSAAAAGLTAAPSSTSADASALGVSAGLGSGSTGLGSGSYGSASTGADSGVGDASATAGADQAAAPAEDLGSGLLAGGPQVGATASAQLAAAESKRAAKNTANGLLGGILLLLGSMVWAVGMAVFGKKA
jgi:hypothetical protein